MSKPTTRKPFFAQLLEHQKPGADIETQKWPSDKEDLAWGDTQLSSKVRTEKK